MTGTAMTEDKEFKEIYNLDVVTIPTNLPVIRKDNNDIIYKTEDSKFKAVIEEIKDAHEKGQPVLVGTASIENSEKISKLLKKEGLKHEVLNAKNHEKEAEIVAQAGKYGAITIATNMAGRGTDIMLGGNSEFLAIEEMRRKGRTEAEIAEATAYNDTDDEYILELRKEYRDLNKKFKDEIEDEKDKLAIDETMPIQVGFISKALENAQKRVEGINFDSRKRTLNYDDVMNAQREIIYAQRRVVLDGEDVDDIIQKMVEDTVDEIVNTYQDDIENNKLNKALFKQEIINLLTIDSVPELEKEKVEEVKEEKAEKTEEKSDKKNKKKKKEKKESKSKKAIINHEILRKELKEKALEILKEKKEQIGKDFAELERVVMLKVVDDKWMEHLDNMEDLRNGIGLRGYAQKDPVVQYRIEGTYMFEEMITEIKLEITKLMMHVYKDEHAERTQSVEITGELVGQGVHIDKEPPKPKTEKGTPVVNKEIKVGRNEKCPCGSGKKYKNCCGK